AVKVKDDKHVTVTMPAYAYNLTAVATPNEYIIEYKLNGGMTNNPSKYTIEDGENGFLTLNNPTKAGYEFVGWTGSNGNTPEKNVKVNTKALVKYTYEANWQIIDYTLHCGLEGGTVAIANPTTYNIETPDITLNNPTKPGYVFEGWTGDCGAVPKKVVTIPQGSSGTKFYLANWKEADDTGYKVEHYKEKADGSFELAETDNLQGTTGSTVHPAVKNYTGYASPEVSLLTIAADGSSVLKYYYAFKKYKVALVEGEGLEYITGDGLYPCDSEVTIKTKAKPGYRFVGWERESDHQMFDEANYSFTMPSNPVLSVLFIIKILQI
ncbi:MAG: InlB B-repeat-containing protein, partial [Lachnospiraceae bacterium]|nr:InlB B-repeat-containing protein [Lachnospiraceae bacterium]